MYWLEFKTPLAEVVLAAVENSKVTSWGWWQAVLEPSNCGNKSWDIRLEWYILFLSQRRKEEKGRKRLEMQDIYSKRKKSMGTQQRTSCSTKVSCNSRARRESCFFIFGRFSDSHDEQENNNFLLIYHKFYLYMYFWSPNWPFLLFIKRFHAVD